MQFLAMLYPDKVTAMEHLFERSLIALLNIDPKSPDYSILKARALLYLHRRPAALVALGTPNNPESKALLAVLNGNLPELKKWTTQIQSPFNRAMAEIELNDLRRLYKESITEKEINAAAAEYPNWSTLMTQRLMHGDSWYNQSNAEIKLIMDDVFPIENFTAADIAKSRMALGKYQLEDTEMKLSPCRHYLRLMENKGEAFFDYKDNPFLTQRDYLDMLYAVSENNLFKGILIELHNIGLEKNALVMIDDYESVYHDHPGMVYLRGSALIRKWKVDKKDEYLINEKDDLRYKVYYWAGGQVDYSYMKYSASFPFYDADYPSRYFWTVNLGDRKDIKGSDFYKTTYDQYIALMKDFPSNKGSILYVKNLIIALKYTTTSFSALRRYHKQLFSAINSSDTRRNYKEPQAKHIEHGEVNDLMEYNKDRFIGHPQRITFAVEEKKDNPETQKIKTLEEAMTQSPDLWFSYNMLGNIYIRRGDFKKAQETFLKWPIFKNENESDRVYISNIAFEAALNLWTAGAVDESIPLFQIAIDTKTGSGSEMMSDILLAMMHEDYYRASIRSLDIIKRYKNNNGYRIYITILHMFGYHEEAWSIFNNLNMLHRDISLWTSAYVGQRMESKTNDEIIKWLRQDNFKKVPSNYISIFLLKSMLTDRMPDKRVPEFLEKAAQDYPPPANAPEHTNYLAKCAEGYYYLRKGEYEKSYNILKTPVTKLYSLSGFVLPYYVWSGIKANRISEIDTFLQKEEKDYFRDLEEADKIMFYLSKAVYCGLQGKHEEAVRFLKQSRYVFTGTGDNPLFPLYQMVELCEWLYKETLREEYKNLALEWSRIIQRTQPYFAWAYAVEARYSNSEPEKTRALAITLYLDKDSERIADFSKADKENALKWLEKNNPFLKGFDEKTSKKEIIKSVI